MHILLYTGDSAAVEVYHIKRTVATIITTSTSTTNTTSAAAVNTTTITP